MKKVLCFGELLFRISPSAADQLGNRPMMLFVGGAEANVATALAGWNIPVKYCTVLPDNFMSRHVMHYLEYKGIYTSSIILGGERIGVYYLDSGADLKGVMAYDRDRSAFSQLKPGTIDWDKMLQDVSWFNFSAINPALNQNIADVCLEALEAASRKNITISVDLNYRSRLWNYGKKPADIMPQLVSYCDVVMGNIWSSATMLGTALDDHIHDKNNRRSYLDHAASTSQEIMQRFGKCTVVANTFRFDSNANDILYYTALYTGGQLYASRDLTCSGVVDRSGSGDCFMAGLIYGLHKALPPQEVVEYATAAAFAKLQEAGDATNNDALTVTKLHAG